LLTVLVMVMPLPLVEAPDTACAPDLDAAHLLGDVVELLALLGGVQRGVGLDPLLPIPQRLHRLSALLKICSPRVELVLVARNDSASGR
jgi:hypothetical protein